MACDYPERDLEELKGKFVLSGQQMLADGFFEEKVKLDKFTVAKRFIRSWFKLQSRRTASGRRVPPQTTMRHLRRAFPSLLTFPTAPESYHVDMRAHCV